MRDASHGAEWETTFEKRTGIMIVKVHGRIVRGAWLDLVKHGATMGHQFGARKHLIDYSAAEMLLTVSDLFDRPQTLDDAGMPRSWAVALVFPGPFAAEYAAFIEDVALNRGYSSRVFTAVDKARNWLINGDPDDPDSEAELEPI